MSASPASGFLSPTSSGTEPTPDLATKSARRTESADGTSRGTEPESHPEPEPAPEFATESANPTELEATHEIDNEKPNRTELKPAPELGSESSSPSESGAQGRGGAARTERFCLSEEDGRGKASWSTARRRTPTAPGRGRGSIPSTLNIQKPNPRLHPLLALGIALGLAALLLPNPDPAREHHSDPEILTRLLAPTPDPEHGPLFWLQEIRHHTDLYQQANQLCQQPPHTLRPGCQLLATLEAAADTEEPPVIPQGGDR